MYNALVSQAVDLALGVFQNVTSTIITEAIEK